MVFLEIQVEFNYLLCPMPILGGRHGKVLTLSLTEGRKMKQKGEAACLSLPCELELGFTTSCLPTQFSFLQTTPPLRSAPGEQITRMYFIPQRRKSHSEK